MVMLSVQYVARDEANDEPIFRDTDGQLYVGADPDVTLVYADQRYDEWLTVSENDLMAVVLP
jgi:hypothetical protein